MSMSMTELEGALRALRLSDDRHLAGPRCVAHHQMDSPRRSPRSCRIAGPARSRLLGASALGLPERKD
jgi:hypothetical protein